MNTLLLFFALPVATILLAIVVEKILRNPFLTAITFFAIYLIVAFADFDATFLIYTIAYTILAFITAIIAEFFFQRCRGQNNSCCKWVCRCNQSNNNNTVTLSDQDVTRIANRLAELQNQNNNNSCSCNCSRNNNTSDVATVNVTNNTTGGRTSWCCYRKWHYLGRFLMRQVSLLRHPTEFNFIFNKSIYIIFIPWCRGQPIIKLLVCWPLQSHSHSSFGRLTRYCK